MNKDERKQIENLLAQPNLTGFDLMAVLRIIYDQLEEVRKTYNEHVHEMPGKLTEYGLTHGPDTKEPNWKVE